MIGEGKPAGARLSSAARVTAAMRLLCNFVYEEVWAQARRDREDEDEESNATDSAEAVSKAAYVEELRSQLDAGPCLPASDGSWVKLSDLAFYDDTDHEASNGRISTTLGLKQHLPAAVKRVCPLTRLPDGAYVKDHKEQLQRLFCHLLGLKTLSTRGVVFERCERLDSVGAPAAAGVMCSQLPPLLLVATVALQRKTAGFLSQAVRDALRERLRSLRAEQCPGLRPLLCFALPATWKGGGEGSVLKAIEEPMILPQNPTVVEGSHDVAGSGCGVFLETHDAQWTLLHRAGRRLQRADAPLLARQLMCGVDACAGTTMTTEDHSALLSLLQAVMSEDASVRGLWWVSRSVEPCRLLFPARLGLLALYSSSYWLPAPASDNWNHPGKPTQRTRGHFSVGVRLMSICSAGQYRLWSFCRTCS